MKCIKKMLALLLVLAISVSFAVTTVFAADGLTITVGTASGKAGDTVTVPVTFSNNPGILSAKLTFGFNSDLLELTNITNGEVFTGVNVLFEANIEKGTVVFDNSTADSAVSANGALLTLTFKIRTETAAGNYSVTVTPNQIVGSALAAITAEAVAGEITVVSGEGPSMDNVDTGKLPEGAQVTITEDGKLNVKNDTACVVLVKQADGSYERATAVKNEQGSYDFDIPADAEIVVAVKCDVTGDGVVNANDAFVLNRIAGGAITPNALQTAVGAINGGQITANDAFLANRAAGGAYTINW